MFRIHYIKITESLNSPKKKKKHKCDNESPPPYYNREPGKMIFLTATYLGSFLKKFKNILYVKP